MSDPVVIKPLPFLNRIDAAPLEGHDFTPEFKVWLSVLVDGMNTTIQEVHDYLENVNERLLALENP